MHSQDSTQSGYRRFRVLAQYGPEGDRPRFSVYDSETDTVFEETATHGEAQARAATREQAARAQGQANHG